MPVVRKYLEEDSFVAVVAFRDVDNASAAPDSARYRIDCLTSGRPVRDWVVLTPATTIEILVEPDDNAIINDRNRIEKKQMVVQFNYDSTSQKSSKSVWEVENLQGVRPE